MQLRIGCNKRLYVPITSGSFEAKISIDIQQTFFLFCNNVSIIEDKIFATDFLRFFRVISKKRKSHVFWNLKKTKNTYSRTLEQWNDQETAPNTGIYNIMWCLLFSSATSASTQQLNLLLFHISTSRFTILFLQLRTTFNSFLLQRIRLPNTIKQNKQLRLITYATDYSDHSSYLRPTQVGH